MVRKCSNLQLENAYGVLPFDYLLRARKDGPLHNAVHAFEASSVDDLLRACNDGPLHDAVDALEALSRRNVSVSKEVLTALFEKCAKKRDLAVARRLQWVLLGEGSRPVPRLADQVIRLFSSCGSLADANRVFSNISKPRRTTWTTIIQAHAKLGASFMAIKLYCRVHLGNVKGLPDEVLMKIILKACTDVGDVDHGRLVHHQATCMNITNIVSELVFMYVKGGSLDDALSIFSRVQNQDVWAWSVLIAGCSECGCSARAFELFQEMLDRGVEMDHVVILCILKACSSSCQGMYVHNQAVKQNLESVEIIPCAIVDMYIKCGSLEEAFNMFSRVPNKNAILWTCIIAGCVDLKQDNLALELFQGMLSEGTMPNEFSFASIFRACGNATDLEQGRIVHDMKIRADLTLSVIEGNTLVDMYAKCGALDDALGVFDRIANKTVISWGTAIHACADYGCSENALRIFDEYQEINPEPDDVIYLGVVKACGNIGNLSQGRKIHNNIIKHGFAEYVAIGNTLVDMYSKCHKMDEALNVFDALPSRSCVSWSAMLAGYNQKHEWTIALELFGKLLTQDLELDEVIFLEGLEACGNVGSMQQAMLIHDQIVRRSFESYRQLGNALLDSYGKCGYMHESYRVFERTQCKCMVTWGAMISKLVHKCMWSLARTCLSEMRKQGMCPSLELYSCVLIACSSAGLVEDGQWFFNRLKEDHANSEKIEHLSCMVDLFGRVGLLDESEDFVQTMPIPPNESSWTSLLTGCKTYHRLQAGNFSLNEDNRE
ncbi:hypothetical protein GOP47_0027038 [Adiantum capillus-veneris]|nr:hypothetical protein GOP47_0027038 [Adiantum capillus-veneris]